MISTRCTLSPKERMSKWRPRGERKRQGSMLRLALLTKKKSLIPTQAQAPRETAWFLCLERLHSWEPGLYYSAARRRNNKLQRQDPPKLRLNSPSQSHLRNQRLKRRRSQKLLNLWSPQKFQSQSKSSLKLMKTTSLMLSSQFMLLLSPVKRLKILTKCTQCLEFLSNELKKRRLGCQRKRLAESLTRLKLKSTTTTNLRKSTKAWWLRRTSKECQATLQLSMLSEDTTCSRRVAWWVSLTARATDTTSTPLQVLTMSAAESTCLASGRKTSKRRKQSISSSCWQTITRCQSTTLQVRCKPASTSFTKASTECSRVTTPCRELEQSDTPKIW